MRVNGSPSTCVIQKSKRRFRYDNISYDNIGYDTYICT